jgi:hypothetical protein
MAGERAAVQVTFDEGLPVARGRGQDLVAVDDALEALAMRDWKVANTWLLRELRSGRAARPESLTRSSGSITPTALKASGQNQHEAGQVTRIIQTGSRQHDARTLAASGGAISRGADTSR